MIYCSTSRMKIFIDKKAYHCFMKPRFKECSEIPTNYPGNYPSDNLHTIPPAMEDCSALCAF